MDNGAECIRADFSPEHVLLPAEIDENACAKLTVENIATSDRFESIMVLLWREKETERAHE